MNADRLDPSNVDEELAGVDGILVPGGFGDRGVEGKVAAATWAARNAVPYFGICLGMQCATISAARALLDLEKANSSELTKQFGVIYSITST